MEKRSRIQDKKYLVTQKIRPEQFLMNIGYTWLTKKDFDNKAFVSNAFVMTSHNLDLLSLERKINNVKDQKFV